MNTNGQFSPDEKTPLSVHDSRKNFSGKSVRGMIAAVLAMVIIVGGIYLIHDMGIRNRYSNARELVMEEKYEEALTGFREIEKHHYRDTDAFISYCIARRSYDRGQSEEAAEEMIWVRFAYEEQEFLDQVEAFRTEVRGENEE